jgi:uncharacterized membrane protein
MRLFGQIGGLLAIVELVLAGALVSLRWRRRPRYAAAVAVLALATAAALYRLAANSYAICGANGCHVFSDVPPKIYMLWAATLALAGVLVRAPCRRAADRSI